MYFGGFQLEGICLHLDYTVHAIQAKAKFQAVCTCMLSVTKLPKKGANVTEKEKNWHS